ncbi:MAG: response regulator [Planctomycetes bacterium]|nr:response regulator [Planctomycetota bacterium]
MEPKGTVYVVDDDPGVRTSLRRLLEEVSLPCQAFGTANEFLKAYSPASPGCLVLDVRMPGMSGIELHKRLVAEDVTIPVIIISGHGDIPMAAETMRRGAVDFMEKPVSPQTLLDRIQQALARDAETRRAKVERDAVAARAALLTPREREVVDLAVTGMANKQIAAQFGVSSQAIDAHRAKAMKKLQAENVAELVRLMITVSGG